MGLRLPLENYLSKLIYIALEFLLIISVNIMTGRGIGFSPPLLLILVIRSCLIFKQAGRLLLTSLVLIFFISNVVNNNIPFPAPPKPPIINGENIRYIVWNLKLNIILLFSFLLMFVFLLVNALISERESREKLAMTHEQLRQYSLRIEDQATLQERNRIAREIHDALGHSLTAQSIQIENALLFLQSNIDKTQEFLLSAKNLGVKALKEVNQSVTTLRSDPLLVKSLEDAISVLLAEFQSRIDITPNYSLRLEQQLPPEVSRTVYRIVQEALTNISKHSGATQVTIAIQATANSLILRVEDNGIGFNPDQNTTGFGLQGMYERAAALGGQLYITSELGSGCNIIAFIPLSRLKK